MIWNTRNFIIGLMMILAVSAIFARNYTGQLYFEVKAKEMYRSGELLKKSDMNRNAPSMETQLVFLYFEEKPNNAILGELRDQKVEIFENSWRPPNSRHPWGFFTGRIPATMDMLNKLEANPLIVQIRTAEGQRQLYNDLARQGTGVDVLQAPPYDLDGSNVRIGIIDSGFEIASLDLDMPEHAIDYSAYPDSDYTVSNANTGTGHGTHVAGSIVGLGTNSGGVWRGMAPGAQWYGFKVITDYTHIISDAALSQSYWSACYQHNCDMVNVSIGGWDDYLDGSGALEQVIDQVSEDGMLVFQSAGNEADDDRHASGTLDGGESDYVPVNVPESSTRDTYIFNLVWYDSPDTTIQRPMTLYFHDENLDPINPIWQDIDDMTQSPRGTQSRWGMLTRPGDDPFYVRVLNQTGHTMDYHLYSMSTGGQFSNPDSMYTISSPAVSDMVISIGSWTTRARWHSWNHFLVWVEETVGEYSPFSARGPRIDGVQKPELSAPGSFIASIRDDDAMSWPFGTGTTSVLSNSYAQGDSTTGGLPADYFVAHGTSMSSPIACGAAALIKQFDLSLTRDEIVDLLLNNTRNDGYTGDLPNAKFGYGKIDVEAAILALIGDQAPAQVRNVEVGVVGEVVFLTWDPVTETVDGYPISPDYYRVYGATEPHTEEWVELTTTTQTTSAFSAGSGYRFFYVTCIDNP